MDTTTNTTTDAIDIDNDDVVSIIRQQHQVIRQLLADVDTGDVEARQMSFEALVRLLAVHETAEEMVVYPYLRKLGDDGSAVADARAEEEDEAKKMLADLEGMDVSTTEFSAAMATFRREVELHAMREQTDVIPMLMQADADRRRSMAKAFTAAEAIAPTHAHRAAPEGALANMMVGPFVAMVDRVRDAIRDSGRDSA